jgi:Mg2+ and Co2+ transporter CorA
MALTDNQTSAIIGGLIGTVASLGVLWLTIWNENSKRKREDKKNYYTWINALSAEIEHIKNCINEINGYLHKELIPTKRMNSDFIEKSRFVLFNYNKDKDFLVSLTTCYRDIVHTNEMLERLEDMYRETHTNKLSFMNNVKSSMDGVEGSLQILEEKINNILNGKKKVEN